jgi:hypothetical protein|nr:MAG TPA: tail completion protein [Caudoviricetes sp.]
MIDMTTLQNTVVTGLSDYLEVSVICAHQTGEAPARPYVSYTVTNLINENKETWGRYDDGKIRKPLTQTWAVTIWADNIQQAMELAIRAYDWLDFAGRIYLGDHHVIVKSVTKVSNLDTEAGTDGYRYGFDVVFQVTSELENDAVQTGIIETAEITYENNK